jgi:predicted molibdopterin-dependent oxidoreductase YjgC
MTETFDFDGVPVPYAAGQSIGAALIAAGVLSWRTTREHARPRGIFCGIGICFDCLVVVDGRPNCRACIVTAQAGMTVRSQEGTGRGELSV